ncbi:RNA polymerase sigma factor [Aquisalimonas asiatica]|uniref:RNA polymerase sigma-70 factor, ECF subfamily n=1 Tax=Aquisalimonas asiatica TaxID=406100 RepID=A0A1H8RX83_9GAMM|nr:RNA polymerase sigma factor [Aquisalimonas asiatica]SEO70907.1 RNA polymerase sigma-70 factor, ECF subfamily [Aquisalimonas asiatica]
MDHSGLHDQDASTARRTVEALYRDESRRVLATLIRLLGDFELAEEALHEAFRAALEQWPRDGLPDNPRAWLVSTGRFKAIDGLRRRRRFSPLGDPGAVADGGSADPGAIEDEGITDDRLRLIFTCCHPALSADARVALTLREVCDLTTEEIARAFLTPVATVAQRIVRAKAKIRRAGIPYEVPGAAELPQRLDGVLRVIYLVYNEGYTASSGASLVRADLSAEAIRLGRLLLDLLPEPESEAEGLLALMLLQESRREARATDDGDIVLLDDQDRTLWDASLIAEGVRRVEQALRRGHAGPYALQAAIAAVHAEAATPDQTDWPQIIALYDLLLRLDPSPVVALNRGIAVAMRDGAEAGLAAVDAVIADGRLDHYHLAHAARADLLRRLGRGDEAAEAYRRALALVQQEPEARFLQRRLAALTRALA